MSETLFLEINPGEFSEQVLKEILRSLSLFGDHAIVQLATEIRDERRKCFPLESAASSGIRSALIDSLWWDLYLALISEGVILDRWLDLAQLRRKFKLCRVTLQAF